MSSRNAPDILDVQFLQMRSWLLDLAAALDRIDRAEDSRRAISDPQWKLLQEGLGILASEESDRAERIQMLFSDPYSPDWDQS